MGGVICPNIQKVFMGGRKMQFEKGFEFNF